MTQPQIGKKARRKQVSRKKASRKSANSERGTGSSARGEKHRLKREAILRVASRLINRKGYAGMSLADIASDLSIRNASLYYYFESKERLVFACYERAQRIVGETLQSVEKSPGSGLSAIEQYVVSMRECMREQGELPLAQQVFALSAPHMQVIIAAEYDHGRRLASLIERGIEDGSIRPCNVSLTTRMLLSALRAVPGHYLTVDPAEWPTLDEEVLGAIRHFLAADEG